MASRSPRSKHPARGSAATRAPRSKRASTVAKPDAAIRARVRWLLDGLAKLHPDAHCELDFRTPLELLIATILSAQCTDKRVNQVTPALFARYPDAQAFAAADPRELEKAIQSTGFFRNKARSILAAARRIVEEHDGQVPSTLEELVKLGGVGRKTANVVLGNAFGVPGLTIDTHFGRVARRLGLTRHEDPLKVEADLMRLLPRASWTLVSHQMIFHGRRICAARKPRCEACPLSARCAFAGGPGVLAAPRPKRAPTGRP
ncbi:MAG: endonuclease III [bacterium]